MQINKLKKSIKIITPTMSRKIISKRKKHRLK